MALGRVWVLAGIWRTKVIRGPNSPMLWQSHWTVRQHTGQDKRQGGRRQRRRARGATKVARVLERGRTRLLSPGPLGTDHQRGKPMMIAGQHRADQSGTPVASADCVSARPNGAFRPNAISSRLSPSPQAAKTSGRCTAAFSSGLCPKITVGSNHAPKAQAVLPRSVGQTGPPKRDKAQRVPCGGASTVIGPRFKAVGGQDPHVPPPSAGCRHEAGPAVRSSRGRGR